MLKLIVSFFLLSFISFAHAGTKLPKDIEKIINEFSKKELVYPKDVKETKQILEYLLELDNVDPSRNDVMFLSESYTTYPKVYDSALKEVFKNKTADQKSRLKEIHKILKNFYKNGNG